MKLLTSLQDLIIPFIASADEDAKTKHTGHGLQIKGGGPRTTLVEHHPPKKLESILSKELTINEDAGGKDDLMSVVDSILKYSVNTWDQGFLDKLYASTNAVSSDLVGRESHDDADLVCRLDLLASCFLRRLTPM
jgi:glutamate decarboxylase